MGLKINRARFLVRIGCTAPERENPQAVDVTVQLHFQKGILGADTDKLKDTICYDEMAQVLKSVCLMKEYNLIEHLGLSLLVALRKFLPPGTLVKLEATKISPPVPEILDGVTFICGDLL